MKKLMNRETVLYLIFGVLTTLVNYVVFHLIYTAMGSKGSVAANAVAFVAAVIFAFVVNKLFVFESKSWSAAVLKKEVTAFLASRLASFALEEVGLLVSEHVLHLNRVTLFSLGELAVDGITVAKLALSVIVVVLNYVFCKWFVFHK